MAESKENRDVQHVPDGEGSKLDEPQNAGTSFMSLNDFCCLKIIRQLPLVDLYAMGQTSTRFEALAGHVFCRRYPSKAIVINNITDNCTVHQGLQEKYAKYFTRYIPNVTLTFGEGTTQNLTRLSKLYDDGGCPIKSLRFKDWKGKLQLSHGVEISGIVASIESVTFTGMKIDGDLYGNMLQFMPNVKRLTFCKTFGESVDADLGWMDKTYPNLEYLAWYDCYESFQAAQLKLMFDRNPTIRHFSLLSTSKQTIEQLKNSSISVDELFIDFDRFDHMKRECTDTLECLLVLCTRQPGMRLHMKCNEASRYYLCQHFDELKPLSSYIEGLYFESIDAIDGIRFTGPLLHQFIFDCTNLKVLQLNHDASIDWTQVTPKLETIFFYYKTYNQAVDSVMYHTHQLRKIVSRNAEMGKLKIYISSLACCTKIDKLNQRDADLVEVIRTETEIVNNPLVFMKEPRIKRKGPRAPISDMDRAMLRFIYS